MTLPFGNANRAALGAAVAVLAAAFLLAPGPPAGLTNGVQLDNGICGHNLQLGSLLNASSSARPGFLIYGDGRDAHYAISVDGSDWGTFGPADQWGDVCVRSAIALTDGPHLLEGSELLPAATALRSFVFTVDTQPPATPLISGTTVASVAMSSAGVSTAYGLAVRGVADPRVVVRVLSNAGPLTTATADAVGNWNAGVQGISLGLHVLMAVAVDEAGNQSPASEPVSVTVP